MVDIFSVFESFVRGAYQLSEESPSSEKHLHPFEKTNIHDALPLKVRSLFDDGHYSQATFEAFKFVDKEVSRLSKLRSSGEKLMMKAFNEDKPILRLNKGTGTSDLDEQRGYRFLFAGGCIGIRNPLGHEYDLKDDPGTCLDHLLFASMLLRKLEEAGFRLSYL